MPKCPYCGEPLTSGEECRFLGYTGYCWSCYPDRDQLIDILMGEVRPSELYFREDYDYV